MPLNFLLRLGRAGHAGELAVHAEIILERDGRQRLALALHLHVLLRLDGLMQTVAVAAADHQAAGEFIDDNDLVVLHHVVHVALHQRVGAQRGVDVVQQLVVGDVGKVLHAEPALRLAHARLGQVAGLLFLVDDVILAHRRQLLVGERVFSQRSCSGSSPLCRVQTKRSAFSHTGRWIYRPRRR